ncbi:MAG TPA: 3-methyl-2-oxobutanoate dehydrogenase subunit VorB [Candidatus Marinimicrobia bacterium]|jgi:pyruvate/2-oxoacid:ferredoxin oxidoreductase alpha subunit|nr:3-methyl-2-oxobutanoate dehydrogenase subunit VorB [Candidatus Neomarinimicrobiota bacterium]HOG74747.1 3-methyl-2-oxobutanoate dehydrogenase subunit VorB [Candidatus Neomarinimicrobiota bacterium]HOU18173.1 3-methyl-2-oxobutanoate dehydrogenase subunit VorB [Candidatus Neomarinimicrobiota bacterium]HOV22864.1 3-methyl-2-oxobutanoate dehydrogenase subunit VorB [Candidatus Neomarinimicrobiota bacterium]HPA99803.1 3-methyl-2-oxobutanoate dehydrogenase subunit VorB [Candidatus Neomarinimicrobio
MAKQFLKGNEAVVKGAVLAGCQAYYGYPITPASEIAHAAALYLPVSGGTFLQAESEIAAINMVYGAAAAGQRVMTASSGPGISLKQEGISYCAGSELPCVIVDVMRGGPGLGNIAPEQGDYNQVVKGGGHGNYKCIVLAPNSVQEMCDFGMLAFDLADKYRNPVYILSDGFVGQMMEPVEFPEPVKQFPEKSWAIKGTPETSDNLITSIELDPDDLERHNLKLQQKYAIIEEQEVRFEDYSLSDAEIVLVGFGIISRILQTIVDNLRDVGVKVGLLRPITLFPFPKKKISQLAEQAKFFLVVEMSNGQLVDDVRLAVAGRKPVYLYNRLGGNVPSEKEINDELLKLMRSV